MIRSTRTLFGIGLPILAIVIFAFLLAFSLIRLSDIEQDMRIEATQNMLWVLSRSHIASLRLSDAAAKRSMNDIEQPALELRYQLFLSQLGLLNDGPQHRQMEELGVAAALDDCQNQLSHLTTLISTLKPNDLQSPKAIDALLAPYNAMLTQAANKAMVAEWDSLGGKLDTSRRELWQITISLIGISLAGAFLSGHFLLTARDARRRARLLEREKAFSQLLIGSSGEGIIAVDRDQRCTVWNEAAERLFGQPDTRTIGWSLGELSGFFQIDRIKQALDDALLGNPTALFDQPFFPPDLNEPLYVDLRFFSLRDEGRIIGSILLITDVTDRREAQREIAEHRDHLELLVQARTQELDAALERERATADLYRNFGTMISHQFRTPLAIVDSALQRLMRRSHSMSAAEVVERSDKARQALTRLTKLVESTLDAARLDAGQIEISAQPCNLAELIAEISHRQEETVHGKKIIFANNDTLPLIVRCDPVHAENILVNLISNAIKYSPTDTPININIQSNGMMAECSVTNQGELDVAFERNNLFERYFRGKNAEGRPGIGIGLYMARTLARMQGGDVRLDDMENGYVIFTLTLPRDQVAGDENPAFSTMKEPA